MSLIEEETTMKTPANIHRAIPTAVPSALQP
jgi:hypothetical protein